MSDSLSDMEPQRDIAGPDRALAEAVIGSGDERAFREMYRRHTPRILGFVWRLLGRSEAEAEDVVQEVWVRACRNLERFNWNSTLSTWLLGIALNVVRDHIRRAARSRSVVMESPPDKPAPAVAHEDRIDLERTIAALSDDARLVLVLHDVEGMKHREIAERLGISEGTSRSRLFAARRTVRAALKRSKGDRR